MKKIVFFLALILASCSSNKMTPDTAVAGSEAVVLSVIKIMYDGKDITKHSKIYFDENKNGSNSYRLDATGEMITKMAIGNHYIKMIYTPYGSVNLPDGFASFRVEANKAYYIGDLEIKTDGLLSKKYQGAIYDTSPKWQKEKKPVIKLSTSEKIKEKYKSEFSKTLQIENALILLEADY